MLTAAGDRRRRARRRRHRAGADRGGARPHRRARSAPRRLHRRHGRARARARPTRSMRRVRAARRWARSQARPSRSKNLFDIAGLPTRAGSKINRDRAAGSSRRDADHAARGGGRRAASAASTWANTPTISPARMRMTAPRAIRMRLDHMTGGSSGGSGGGGRGRSRADRARLRHQRLDPRAELLLRPVRPEADLRPAVARRHLSLRREPRSSRAVRAHRRRSRPRLRRDAGPGRRRSRARGRAADAARCRAWTRARGAPDRAARRLFRARRRKPAAFAAVDTRRRAR